MRKSLTTAVASVVALMAVGQVQAEQTTLPFDAGYFDAYTTGTAPNAPGDGYVNSGTGNNTWRQLGSAELPAASAYVYAFDPPAPPAINYLHVARNSSTVSYWTPYAAGFSYAPTLGLPSVSATFDMSETLGNDQAFHGFYARSGLDVFLSAGVGSDGHIYFGGQTIADYGAYNTDVTNGLYFNVLFDLQNHGGKVEAMAYGATAAEDYILASGTFAVPFSSVTEMGIATYHMPLVVPVGDLLVASGANYTNLTIAASDTVVPEPVALGTIAGLGMFLARRPRRSTAAVSI